LTYEDYLPLLGIKSAEVVRTILKVLEVDEANKCLITKSNYFNEVVKERGLKAVQGAKEFLEEVRKLPVKVALATSSRKDKMRMVLAAVGFEHLFDELVSGDEVTKSKPEPDIFLHAAKKLGVTAEQCIVVEDAVNGVTAAKKAGMKCIAITTTHTKELLKDADIVIDSYEGSDLRQLVLGLSGN
jgi:HAD superfamily hydrolase (TIGR01509 family)